MLNKQIS